jgi:hypothetical protein
MGKMQLVMTEKIASEEDHRSLETQLQQVRHRITELDLGTSLGEE